MVCAAHFDVVHPKSTLPDSPLNTTIIRTKRLQLLPLSIATTIITIAIIGIESNSFLFLLFLAWTILHSVVLSFDLWLIVVVII